MTNNKIIVEKKEAENILFAINELIDALYDAKIDDDDPENDIDISAALGEAFINGKVYQIQIHLVNNKNLWQKETGVEFRQTRRVYD